MIYYIETPEQAEKILRQIAERNSIKSFLVFDISKKISDARDVPLCLRACKDCDNPSEYLGWNIWGENMEKKSAYCKNCGMSMRSLAEVDLAIQCNRVINTNWRYRE